MFETGIIVILWLIYSAIKSNNPAEVKKAEEARERKLKDYYTAHREEDLAWVAKLKRGEYK